MVHSNSFEQVEKLSESRNPLLRCLQSAVEITNFCRPNQILASPLYLERGIFLAVGLLQKINSVTNIKITTYKRLEVDVRVYRHLVHHDNPHKLTQETSSLQHSIEIKE